MAILGVPLPWGTKQYTYENSSQAVINGSLKFTQAGLINSPATTYTTSALTVASPLDSNGRVALDSSGRVTVWLSPNVGYDIYCFGQLNGVENVPLSFNDVYGYVAATSNTVFDEFGTSVLYPGSKLVTNGYQILPADVFVTINAASGTPNVDLPAAADHPQVLLIKNMGPNAASITPDGTETIDGVAGMNTDLLQIPGSGNLPCVWLLNDGVSAWFCVAAFGIF